MALSILQHSSCFITLLMFPLIMGLAISATTSFPTENTPSPTTSPVSALPQTLTPRNCAIIKQFAMQTSTGTTVLTTGDIPIFHAPEPNACVPITLTMTYDFNFTWCDCPGCIAQVVFGVSDAPDVCVGFNPSAIINEVSDAQLSVTFTSDGTSKRILAKIEYLYSCSDRDPTISNEHTYGYIDGISTAEPTINPTINPTVAPTVKPTVEPSQSTATPTMNPTAAPTMNPTMDPITLKPTTDPTVSPITRTTSVDSMFTTITSEMNQNISSHSVAREQKGSQTIIVLLSIISIIATCGACIGIGGAIYWKRKYNEAVTLEQMNKANQSLDIEVTPQKQENKNNIGESHANSQFVDNKVHVHNGDLEELEFSESSSNEELWENQPTVEGNTAGDNEEVNDPNATNNGEDGTHGNNTTATGYNVTASAMLNDQVVKGMTSTRHD